ncbi:MAG: hypothetical protein AB7L66_13945, partial [Gemmatimonadales bacterium]
MTRRPATYLGTVSGGPVTPVQPDSDARSDFPEVSPEFAHFDPEVSQVILQCAAEFAPKPAMQVP